MKKNAWTIWAAGAALILAAGGLALGAEKSAPLPKDLPPYGEAKPLAPKDLEKFKLPNGLEVWVIPEKGFPKVAMALAVHGGYSADAKDRPGFADLLAATVAEGTKTHSAKQIAEAIQSLGGDLQEDATADAIVISTAVLAEGFPKAVQLLADIGQNASFPAAEVKLAAENLRSTIEGQEASPDFLARRALYQAAFGDHPYATIAPTKDSLAASSDADLKREYARRFRPDQALFVVVGDVSEAGAKSAITAAFGSWQNPATEPVPATPEPAPSRTTAVVYVPRAGSVQTSLYLGAFMPSPTAPDYHAALLANAIYGGTFGSRLVLNIREDKGYTYSPFSRISSFEKVGLLVTRADVRNEVTGPAYNEITYELNRVATTAPADPEITQAKRYMVGTLAVQSQSRAAVVLTLTRLWAHAQPAEELWKTGEQLEQVSASDIEAAGKKYFPASRMTVVAVGEEKVIKDSLTPFGLEFKKAQ